MPGLAGDVAGGMGEVRVNADQDDGIVGREHRVGFSGEDAGKAERGPASLGEDPPIAGGWANRLRRGGAKPVDDGAPPHGEDRSLQENKESAGDGSGKDREEVVPESAKSLG